MAICSLKYVFQGVKIQIFYLKTYKYYLFFLNYKANKELLFTQTKKKALAISRKCLIFFVDQPGLEPGTSRL